MNTLENVFRLIDKANKIEETKLSSHKIELALADDLKKAVKDAQGSAAMFGKAKATIDKSIAAMKASADMIKNNKDWGKKASANAQKYKAQLDKLAKELGVNLVGSEPDKLLSELFMHVEDVQGDIDDALAALQTLK
jgi:hypothetical protein